MWVCPAGHWGLASRAGDGAAAHPAMLKALGAQQNPRGIHPLLSERLVTVLGPRLALFEAEQRPRCEGVNPAHGQPRQTPGRWDPAALPQRRGWRKSRCRCREAITGDAMGARG